MSKALHTARNGSARVAFSCAGLSKPEEHMDKDRVEGAAKQVKGKVKDAAGKLTGDEKMRAEGKMDKAEGKVQNTYGGMKDKAREALDDE
jgi:uncharacterized protein YjbJ (UPF0337 family)